MEDEEKEYYLSRYDNVVGPFSLDEIKRKLRRRDITTLHKIEVNGEWESLKAFLDRHRREQARYKQQEDGHASTVQDEQEVEWEDTPHTEQQEVGGASSQLPALADRSTNDQLFHDDGDENLDVCKASEILILNPVAEMAEACAILDSSRRFWVGVFFGLVSSILLAVSVGSMFGMVFSELTLKDVITLQTISAVPFISLTLAMLVTRVVCQGEGDLSHSVLISGASLFPLAISVAASRFIGLGNIEVVIVVMTIAIGHTFLTLYMGMTKIHKITERFASIALPILLLIAAWICKIIYTLLIEHELLTPY